jgi:hypothetical protein
VFGFFNHRRKQECPVNEEIRVWIENTFIWLIKKLGEEKIKNVRTLLPIEDHFPVKSDDTTQIVNSVLKTVATQMDVDPEQIIIDFYQEEPLELKGDFGYTLFSQPDPEESYSAGLYQGKDENGHYLISIEKNQLKELDKLIATLAHEIAHIKILGEGLLEKNDEHLTDILTVFYGLGIFNANTSFKFYKQTDSWGFTKQGYLSQQEWGYALAIYAYIRNEKSPLWLKFLSKSVYSDYCKSEAFIYENTDKVLV